MGGFIGILLLGVFATKSFNPAGVDGLMRGNSHFFLIQCAAVALSSVWAFAATLGMLWLIDKVTPVHVEDATQQVGLDAGIHGENAYLEDAL